MTLIWNVCPVQLSEMRVQFNYPECVPASVHHIGRETLTSGRTPDDKVLGERILGPVSGEESRKAVGVSI